MNDGMMIFFGFLRRLEQRRIRCTIELNPNDSLLIVPDVPGREMNGRQPFPEPETILCRACRSFEPSGRNKPGHRCPGGHKATRW